MWKKILVPVDGSRASKRALTEAIQIAKQLNAAVHIVHVVPSVVEWGWDDFGLWSMVVPSVRTIITEQTKQIGMEILDAAARQATAAGGTVASKSVIFGVPEEVIVGFTREKGCDVIIMGTHGRKGWERMTLGSVAEYVIRNAGVPVMCLRGVDDGEDGDDGDDENVMDNPVDKLRVPLKQILFPFDNSDISKETLSKLAIPLCHITGAELYLRFQIESSGHRFIETEVGVVKEKQQADNFLKEAGKEAAKILGKDKVFADVEISRDQVADGLCASANEYDLVILSTHGRRGLQRVFMGSVTESLLRSCITPVLTYHPTSTLTYPLINNSNDD